MKNINNGYYIEVESQEAKNGLDFCALPKTIKHIE